MSLFAWFSRFRHARRQRRQLAYYTQIDTVALAGQAAPQPDRVLIVRNDSIGDYLLYRPWLRRLTQELRAQGRHVTLAANTIWADLAGEWDAEAFDELLPVDFAGRFQHDAAYRTGVLRTIGAAGCGEVIYPLHVREPAVENFIRFLHAPVRVGSQGEHRAGPWWAALDAGLTRQLPTVDATLFEFARNREFAENYLGRPLPDVPPPTVPVAVSDIMAFRQQLGENYVVLFPGASARQKRWPAAHFAALAQGLQQRDGTACQLVLAGSPGDREHAQRIVAAAPGVPLLNLCGQTTLPQLAALLAGARLLVSNDTVAAHLAVLAGTPTLTVLMGENYGKFFPYPPALHSAPSRCLFPPDMEARFAVGNYTRPGYPPRMEHIQPARVLAVALEMLALPARR